MTLCFKTPESAIRCPFPLLSLDSSTFTHILNSIEHFYELAHLGSSYYSKSYSFLFEEYLLLLLTSSSILIPLIHFLFRCPCTSDSSAIRTVSTLDLHRALTKFYITSGLAVFYETYCPAILSTSLAKHLRVSYCYLYVGQSLYCKTYCPVILSTFLTRHVRATAYHTPYVSRSLSRIPKCRKRHIPHPLHPTCKVPTILRLPVTTRCSG